MPYKDPKKRKEVLKKASAKHYQSNKKELAAKQRQQRRTFSKRWAEYKASVKCASCGFAHPAAIDFHHPPGTKEHHIHTLVRRRAEDLLFAEIAKCVPLCANCHRIHHHNLREERRAKKKARRANKKGAEAP